MSGNIREYARENCPICGRVGWCGQREDGLVFCKRPPNPRELPGFVYRGMAEDGQTGLYVDAARAFQPPGPPRIGNPSPPIEKPKVNIEELHATCVRAFTVERREELAAQLNLPVKILDVIPIGWCSDRRWWNPKTEALEGPPGCWTFPESNARGEIIGLALRWPTGRKGQIAGGHRGLILPPGWREAAEPVLLVEGASDVLAGRALGLNVIGRPSNSGGADFIAQACRDRKVIIIGENDRKPDGSWPGRDGAELVASKIEAAWGRPVPIAFVPADAKDLRAWFITQQANLGGDPADPEFAALGRQFLNIVQPPSVLLLAPSPRTKRSPRVTVKAYRWEAAADAGPIHADKIDIDNLKERRRFAEAIAAIDATANVEELQTRLMKLEVPEARTGVRRPTQTKLRLDAAGLGSGLRPQIQCNGRQLRDIRNDAVAALKAANDPPRLFGSAGGVARVSLQCNDLGERVPKIEQLSVDAIRGELSDAADWFTLQSRGECGDVAVDTLPPPEIARDLLALPRLDLPTLLGVITWPAFASDGTLIIEDGYHAASGLWHHRTLVDLPPIAESPGTDEISAAKDTLLDIFANFPFVDNASRAHAIALMLLPFIRALIEGPTPLHAIDAPMPGTGKDLLVKAALWPALGYTIGATTAPKEPDEWRKKLTSVLLEASPAVVFSNVAHQLDSEHLAAVLTEVVWKDRQLCVNRMLSLPNRAIWAATGNNLSFSRELARRVAWVRLDAKVELPEERTGFRHPNLLLYLRENRASVVQAALTLVQAWLDLGRPPGPQLMGSFESYARVMGGVLAVAGMSDFLANAGELRKQADSETAEWHSFVQAWWRRWADAWVGTADLSTLLWTKEGERSDLLARTVGKHRDRGGLTQLGMRLSSKRDTVIGGFRLFADPAQGNNSRLAFRLIPTKPETSVEVSKGRNGGLGGHV